MARQRAQPGGRAGGGAGPGGVKWAVPVTPRPRPAPAPSEAEAPGPIYSRGDRLLAFLPLALAADFPSSARAQRPRAPSQGAMERPAPLAVLPFSDPAHALSLLRGLSQLRAERKFLDVTLEAAGGRDFPAHRAVLAAASPYFRAMFAGQLRESRAERVRLHGVPPDMLQLLLDFSYTGRVAVSGDNAEPLLRAADLLQFPAVKEACGAFLQQQLDLTNCLDMQDFAEAFSCAGLASAAQRFILRHVGELGAEQLERLPLARLLRYLRDDGLCVPKEEAAYQLALRWVRADPPRRAAHWPQLLEAVRLPFVRRFYLLAHVEAEPLVARCPPCLRLLREARDFQAARYDRHDRGPCPRMRPRPSTGLAEILVLVGGCDQDCDELVTVDCYNPQTGQWRYLAEFPDHLGGGYSIVALGNDIYVTGEWAGGWSGGPWAARTPAPLGEYIHLQENPQYLECRDRPWVQVATSLPPPSPPGWHACTFLGLILKI